MKIRLDRFRGRGEWGRRAGRRIVSGSRGGTIGLRRSLATATVPLLPSFEESVSVEIGSRSIEDVPIILSVFVRAGRTVASFLREEVGGGERGQGRGGEGEGGVSTETEWLSEPATSLASESPPREQGQRLGALRIDINVIL